MYSLKQLRRIACSGNNLYLNNEHCLKVFNDLFKYKKYKITRKVILVYLLNFSGNSIKIEKISGFLISYRRKVYNDDTHIIVRKPYRNFYVDIFLNLSSPTFYHLEIT